ncbi:MAG: tetratricopeptide repeat protein [Caldilineaceae bacterium]
MYKQHLPRLRPLLALLVLVSLLSSMAAPLWAQEELPEPFCGNLKSEDCDLLRTSVMEMLALESYHTAVTYRLLLQGIPEMPVPTSTTELRVAGDYAFTDAARTAMRTLAVISRAEPLAAIEAIGASPSLLIDLYGGTTADLTITLDLTEEWAELFAEEAEVEWPSVTTVGVRLVDGVLYFDLRELKAFLPELADSRDWVAIEIVQTLETLAANGALADLSAEVASSSSGRSVSGLDPMMVNLITSMRATFGRPALLEEFMTIRRRNDVDLGGGGLRRNREETTGAYFETEFDVLDFIFSDEFRSLLQQVFEIAAATDDAPVAPEEAKQVADIFWFVAPALFRDLEVSSSTTVGLDSGHEVASTATFHWDLTTLIQIIQQFGEVELPDLADEIYIAFQVETANNAFDEPVVVAAPVDAELVPLENLGDQFSRGRIIEGGPVAIPLADSTAEAEAFLAEGKALLAAGDSEAALEQFNQAIVRNPELAEAYYNRGKLRILTSPDAARQDFDQALDLDPSLADAYYQRGVLAANVGDWAAAVDDYDQALALDESHATAFFSRGYAHKQLADYAAALADFSAAIVQDPENYEAYAQRGDVQVILGDYGQGVADGAAAVELAPTYDFAYAVRGNAYYQQGDYEAAIADFDRALELSPSYLWVYTQRANAQIILGNYTAAIDDATAALAIDAENDFAFAVRGNAYRQSGDDAAALADFARAVALNPDYAYAYYSQGLIYQEQGEYEQALAEYGKALAAAPDYIDALLSRGFLYSEQEEYEAALADYATILSIDPDNVVAHNDRAVLLEKMELLDEALTDYSAALAVDPDYRLARENRADLYRRVGMGEEALADFDWLIAEDETDAPSYYRRGLTHADLGEVEKALLDYTEAILLNPDEPVYYRTRRALS